MQKILKHAIYLFLIIFAATAIVSLGALVYLWTSSNGDSSAKDLPYLGWLLGAVIAEVVGVVILFAKKGLKYLPEVEIYQTEDETLQFMKKFIDSGSSVTIVSNRVAWLKKSVPIKDAIIGMAKNGTLLEVITPTAVSEDIRKPLEEAGVVFFITGEGFPPQKRDSLSSTAAEGVLRS